LQAELADEIAAISESNLAAPEDGRTPTESFRISCCPSVTVASQFVALGCCDTGILERSERRQVASMSHCPIFISG
jgi:hypothetical protein